jgi:hypothetical protein
LPRYCLQFFWQLPLPHPQLLFRGLLMHL